MTENLINILLNKRFKGYFALCKNYVVLFMLPYDINLCVSIYIYHEHGILNEKCRQWILYLKLISL